MYRKWPSNEEERIFSLAKRKSTLKHHMTLSPQSDRNVKPRTGGKTSEEESENDNNLVDDDLPAKFKKIKGKTKKSSINLDQDDYIKINKSKRNKKK